MNIEPILDRHGITPLFRPGFHRLVENGTMLNAEFATRLECCTNYKAAYAEILELLSRPYAHLHSSEPTEFVSLDLENL